MSALTGLLHANTSVKYMLWSFSGLHEIDQWITKHALAEGGVKVELRCENVDDIKTAWSSKISS